MNERSKMISSLLTDRKSREDYIRSKLNVLLPSQIRSLRLSRGLKQSELGQASDMKQARISAMERVGEAKYTIETLVRLAAALRVGIQVQFVTFAEMLSWENEFDPEAFEVIPLENDQEFLATRQVEEQWQIGSAIISAIRGMDSQQNAISSLHIGSLNDAVTDGTSRQYRFENQNSASNGVAA